jgi:CheY-like chemotaxis protein
MVRVLCVDDDSDLIEVLQILLPDFGLEATCTTSIEEALTLVETEDFDVVLLDEYMPPPEGADPETLDFGRNTGIEVATRIHKIKPSLPILGLTVVQDQHIQAAMRKAGIIDILVKPAEPDLIVTTLRRYATPRRVRAE